MEPEVEHAGGQLVVEAGVVVGVAVAGVGVRLGVGLVMQVERGLGRGADMLVDVDLADAPSRKQLWFGVAEGAQLLGIEQIGMGLECWKPRAVLGCFHRLRSR